MKNFNISISISRVFSLAAFLSVLLLCGCASSDETPGVSLPEEVSTLDSAMYALYYQADSAADFKAGFEEFLSQNDEYGIAELVKSRISEDNISVYYPADDSLVTSICALIIPVDKNGRSFTIGDLGEMGADADEAVSGVSIEAYCMIEYDGDYYSIESGLAQEQIADNYENVYSETVAGTQVSLNCVTRASEDGGKPREAVVVITFVSDGETIHVRPRNPMEHTEYLDLPAELFELERMEL